MTNSHYNEQNVFFHFSDDKYVDTRTFTRPKKKLNYPFLSNVFGNSTIGFDSYSSSSSGKQVNNCLSI